MLYQNAVNTFACWCRRHGRPYGTHKSADESMAVFLAEQCEEGVSLTEASYTVFGWILLRSKEHLPAKQQMPFSRAALKGWRSRFPGSSRSGVDLCIWDAIALECLQHKNVFTAAAILIQGDAYLRPSEVLGIQLSDIIPPMAARRRGVWGVVIAPEEEGVPSKAGEFDDCILFNTSSRQDVNLVVQQLVARCKKSACEVFDSLTLAQYTANIHQATTNLGIRHLQLTPHGLRHSGASHDSYHKIRDIKEIQFRGRWKAAESVRRYKKPGRMLLTHKQISSSFWKQAQMARPVLVKKLLQALK